MKTNQVVIEKELKVSAAIIWSRPLACFFSTQDVSVETLIDELPSREPRFILHSHELKHADGRIQYPLNLILYIPDGCGTNNRFTYASTANAVSAASGITRVSDSSEPPLARSLASLSRLDH